MPHRLNVAINDSSAEVMRTLKGRYESAQEAIRVAFGIAAVIVDAWQNNWPVVIERPNGSYRLVERRGAPAPPGSVRGGRVLSAVRLVYTGPRKGR